MAFDSNSDGGGGRAPIPEVLLIVSDKVGDQIWDGHKDPYGLAVMGAENLLAATFSLPIEKILTVTSREVTGQHLQKFADKIGVLVLPMIEEGYPISTDKLDGTHYSIVGEISQQGIQLNVFKVSSCEPQKFNANHGLSGYVKRPGLG